MIKVVDWLCSVVRIAGAGFPVASSLVQLQAELSSNGLLKRVQKLEDPISSLHQDVPEVSRLIYGALRTEDDTRLSFNNDFYAQYSKALAVLESHEYLKGVHSLGDRYGGGIDVCDPTYITYMCALAEDHNKMELLIRIIESCASKQQIDGKNIKNQLNLPLPAIKACFKIYESKGYRSCSGEVGSVLYMGKA